VRPAGVTAGGPAFRSYLNPPVSCIHPCNAPSSALKGTRLSHPYSFTPGRDLRPHHLRLTAPSVVKNSGIGLVEVGGQPGFFLTTDYRCDPDTDCEAGWTGLFFNHGLHRYDPDKGRGVGIGILYLSVKSVVKTPGLGSWRERRQPVFFLTQGRKEAKGAKCREAGLFFKPHGARERLRRPGGRRWSNQRFGPGAKQKGDE